MNIKYLLTKKKIGNLNAFVVIFVILAGISIPVGILGGPTIDYLQANSEPQLTHKEKLVMIDYALTLGSQEPTDTNTCDPIGIDLGDYPDSDYIYFKSNLIGSSPGCYLQYFFWSDNINQDQSISPVYTDWVYHVGLAHEDITYQQMFAALYQITLQYLRENPSDDNATIIPDPENNDPILEQMFLETIMHFEGNSTKATSGEATLIDLILKTSPELSEKYGVYDTPEEVYNDINNNNNKVSQDDGL